MRNIFAASFIEKEVEVWSLKSTKKKKIKKNFKDKHLFYSHYLPKSK